MVPPDLLTLLIVFVVLVPRNNTDADSSSTPGRVGSDSPEAQSPPDSGHDTAGGRQQVRERRHHSGRLLLLLPELLLRLLLLLSALLLLLKNQGFFLHNVTYFFMTTLTYCIKLKNYISIAKIFSYESGSKSPLTPVPPQRIK